MLSEINLIEVLGYVASILIAFSLLTNSIIKLRWINLVGAVSFLIYGILISALPIVLTNIVICIIDVFFLIKIYSSKEYFKVLEMPGEDRYLSIYLEFYKDEIKKYFPRFEFKCGDINFYILRNMVTAGVFIARKIDSESLFVDLDFATPEYRDFKVGKYIYNDYKEYFLNMGIKTLYTYALNEEHYRYLTKMGFSQYEKLDGKVMMKKL